MQDFRFGIVFLSISVLCVIAKVHDGTSTMMKKNASLVLLSKFDPFIPNLKRMSIHHKGSSGRIAIMGGSEEYSGAPYYAAMSSLKAGGDLAYVFAEPSAVPILKTYSPELIVFENAKSLHVTSRITALVVGPGLGRRVETFELVKSFVSEARKFQVPIVLDGDALFFLKDYPTLISGYLKGICTPNKIEFERLYNAAFTKQDSGEKQQDELDVEEAAQDDDLMFEGINGLSKNARRVYDLANFYGGVVFIKKGMKDVISNGKQTIITSSTSGSARRCGGQGDVLAGTIGLFANWMNTANQDFLPAVFAASKLVRKANELAFSAHGRSMTTPDMIASIGKAFELVFGGGEEKCKL